MDIDKRVTPARLDIAAAHLKGKVNSKAYVEGRTVQVARGVIGLHGAPTDTSALRSQLLFGERFTVYDEKYGWVWGQSALDDYVGYARADCFGPEAAPTHRVVSLATPSLAAPDVKKGARDLLPMNAKVAVAAGEGRFLRLVNSVTNVQTQIMSIQAVECPIRRMDSRRGCRSPPERVESWRTRSA